jgi:endonuclease IV
MFNSTLKANAKTFEEYIINVFNYMLRDMTLDWCHNYMSKYPDCIFLELTQAFCKFHQKIHNDEQIYMELKNVKREETERVEVYYEWIQKLAHGLQVPTTYNFLTTMFEVSF